MASGFADNALTLSLSELHFFSSRPGQSDCLVSGHGRIEAIERM
jgi:hypothetical protein